LRSGRFLSSFDFDGVGFPRSCINLKEVDAPVIYNVECIRAEVGLLIDPTSASVLSTKISGSYFDTSSVAGMYVYPTGTGNVSRIYADNTWFSNTIEAVHLDSNSSGEASAFSCSDCQFNLSSKGIVVTNKWKDVRITGGCIAQNSILWYTG
jgi:hypothetical protein